MAYSRTRIGGSNTLRGRRMNLEKEKFELLPFLDDGIVTYSADVMCRKS